MTRTPEDIPDASTQRLGDYRFEKDDGAKVLDDSGKGNNGQAKNAALVEGRNGHKGSPV